MSLKTCFLHFWSLRFVWIAKFIAMHFSPVSCEYRSVVVSCSAAMFSVKRKFRRSNIQLQIICTICLLYYFAEWADQYASLCSCDDCQGNSESIWYLRQLPMQCMLWITYCPNGWHFTLLLNALSPELNRLLQQWRIGWRHCCSGRNYFAIGFVWRFAVSFYFDSNFRFAEHKAQRISLFEPRAAWKPAPGQIEFQRSRLSDSPTESEGVLHFVGVSDDQG